jgi:hypothetical protein
MAAIGALGLLPVAAPAALLAHYPFDAGFADASGSGNDLTVGANTPTITSAGGEFVFGGGALDLDSTTSTSEYLDLQAPLVFGASEAWSVTFWARRRAGTDNRTGMVVGDSSNNADFIWVPNNPSVVEGLRFRNSGGDSADFSGITDDNQFHHWAVIADGAGTVTVFRDNISLGSGPIDTTFSITSVGQAFTSPIQSFDGQIDELYIFDEALSTSDVNAIYNGIPEPSAALLVALGGMALFRRRLPAARGSARHGDESR